MLKHAVYHHPNVTIEAYLKIEDTLHNPDAIVETRRGAYTSYCFIKQWEDMYLAVVIQVSENRIIIHKTAFLETEMPYENALESSENATNNSNINIYKKMPLGGGASPIDVITNSDELYRQLTLSALNGKTNIQTKILFSKQNNENMKGLDGTISIPTYLQAYEANKADDGSPLREGDFFSIEGFPGKIYTVAYFTRSGDIVYYYHNTIHGRPMARSAKIDKCYRHYPAIMPKYKIGDTININNTNGNKVCSIEIFEGFRLHTVSLTLRSIEGHLFVIPEKHSKALGAADSTNTLLDGSSENYDSKHKQNLAPNKDIPYSIIENLSKEGITIEDIDKLINVGFPVCKYQTQITIHGNCPPLETTRTASGYVTLQRNNNKSLGVRWRAVDEGKKNKLYQDYLRWYGYRRNSNSTEYYFSKLIDCSGEAQAVVMADRLKKQFSKLLDSKCFFGSVRITPPSYGPMLISPYFHVYIHINGIYEKDIEKFVSLVLDKDIATIKTEVADAKAERERIIKEREAEQKEFERVKALKDEWIINNPPPEGFEIVDYVTDLKANDIIAVAAFVLSSDRQTMYGEWLTYRMRQDYTYGLQSVYKCDPEGTPTDNSTSITLFDGYVALKKKEAPKPRYSPQPTATPGTPKPSSQKPQSNSVEGGFLEVVDYSAKAIAVTGDTKPLKDQLQDLGGKFNSHLSCGAGYIFSKAKSEDAVRKFVEQHNAMVLLIKETEKL